MTAKQSDELVRHLIVARGFQWLFGSEGDPYALLLRAEDEDPLQLAERARERGAVYQGDFDSWVTTQYAAGTTVLTDPRFGFQHSDMPESQHHLIELDEIVTDDVTLCHLVDVKNAFLHMEQDEYERLTHTAAPLLGESALEERRSEAERATRALLDGLVDTFDLAADLARPLATGLTADLIGVPTHDRARFGALCTGLSTALDASLCAQQVKAVSELFTSIEAIRNLLEGLHLDGSRTPVHGLGLLPLEDRQAVGVLLAAAGVETTANLIVNAVRALGEAPNQWTEVRESPDLVTAAILETLRLDPPVRIEGRVAHADVELAGTTVPAGSHTVVWMDAANQDPDVFRNPHTFDLHRDSEPTVLVPTGGPTGFITPLAKAYAEGALSALTTHLSHAPEPTAPVVRRLRAGITRGALRAPVRVR